MRLLFYLGFLSLLLAALNYYLYRKAERLVRRIASDRWLTALRGVFVLMNAPFAALMVIWLAGQELQNVPEWALHAFFYPFFAWSAMLLAFVVVAAPAEIAWGLRHGFRRIFPRSRPLPEKATARRDFLATAASLVPAALFAIMARGVYGSEEIEVSPLLNIPIHGLPRAFDGLTITQLSDLHAGAYIREPELARVAEIANGLRSDLVVITGDILDFNLDTLPVAQRALARLRAPLGVYAILGNHDYYADGRLPDSNYPGCMRIMEGMRQVGVRMLRDSQQVIRSGNEEIVLGGIDWTGAARGNPNLYLSAPTREALRRTFAGSAGRVRILLAHHPHAFSEAGEFRIALTLAGHTHGGGQIVMAERNGRPLALGSPIFRWISGHYQDGNAHLYVNRGIGFVALPIRIQCPAEISRFQLVRA
jgi:hypothetical protein